MMKKSACHGKTAAAINKVVVTQKEYQNIIKLVKISTIKCR